MRRHRSGGSQGPSHTEAQTSARKGSNPFDVSDEEFEREERYRSQVWEVDSEIGALVLRMQRGEDVSAAAREVLNRSYGGNPYVSAYLDNLRAWASILGVAL